MDETLRERLLLVAVAQRKLSIGFAVLGAVILIGSVAIAVGGRQAEFAVQVVGVLVNLYLAAATYHLSGALGHARGLRITLTCVVLFVPFASLVVPLLVLWQARRMLRAEAVEAGFFTVRRGEMERLAKEPGLAMVCAACGYDLAGIGQRVVCPECGQSRE
jgi:hypothetical protein